ncbi:Thylakoid lumenal 15 kDa protein 1 [Hibiscus syriacus]|uniref:Thylakoid lumenal 15 kDa protein 1 n=1 Tax=Hibiscus syriacus TaxID=106335 RepID=A0A6A2YUE2_HIBSY|nr:Thylakoid lumenal 15 kDa protein 1 [Hibiscus syriacus]
MCGRSCSCFQDPALAFKEILSFHMIHTNSIIDAMLFRLGFLASASVYLVDHALGFKGGGPYGSEVTRGQDLTGKDFSGKTLIKQDFKTSILRQANFKGAKLLGASFFDADLTGFDKANFKFRACFYGPVMWLNWHHWPRVESIFHGSSAAFMLIYAYMTDIDLFRVAARADLSEADLRGADFSLANVTKVKINHMLGKFKRRELGRRDCNGNTSFKGSNITGSDFTDVPLRDGEYLCKVADEVNPTTGNATRDTLLCN